jgi:hypothetical protein
MLEFHTCHVSTVKLVNCTFKRKKEKGQKKERTNQEILYSKGGTPSAVERVDFQMEFLLKPIVILYISTQGLNKSRCEEM